ncbi:DUF2931 family protein [Marinobacter fonticola]|uniref:DUF2931 family protein n=1 Tax=Marinobacter fonticola TaxID=2603215 RepID=UPI0011E7F00B|nr:DUF2931 family protein [Marinobacter fonticola]
MHLKKIMIALLIGLILSGCASQPDNSLKAYVGVAAPQHYKVWVEHLELEASGVRHWRMPMGNVGCCWRGPRGPSGSGGFMEPFPNYIAIQWFSFAEQKFYQRLFSLPEGLEDRMREHATYTTSMGTFSRPRDILTIGLAPGGQIVLWIQNQIGNEIEVGRLQANEIEGDASRYQVRTEEYLQRSGEYIEEHGVPTEGW